MNSRQSELKLDGFTSESAFDRAALARSVSALARRNVFLGTSSWKYAGWHGTIYDRERYLNRGVFAERRFQLSCLAEYAKVFKTVCVDAAYYKFPDDHWLEGMVSQVPADFLFALKVTDSITVKRFANLARFGDRAGKANSDFLNPDQFTSAFLRPCEPYRGHVGLLIFEFSRFYPGDFANGREFVSALDTFLARLPAGWPYGVEIRNRAFLQPEYFEMLRARGVAHVFNSWFEMPPVAEQLMMPGSRTSEEVCAARFLLKPGRKYQEAVDLFSPYDQVKEVNESARQAGAALINEGISAPKRKTFIYVNNRLEGSAPLTIHAMLNIASPA